MAALRVRGVNASGHRAVCGALARSMSWMQEHRGDFALSHARDSLDYLLLMKPFAEYLLTIDTLRRVGGDTPQLAAALAWAWEETEGGDALLRLLMARPDFIDAACMYAHFWQAGYRHASLEAWLARLWQLQATQVVPSLRWNHLALHYTFWRLGLTDFPEHLLAGSWIAAQPEPWLISTPTAYAITHEGFYLTEFGQRPERLPHSVRRYLGLWLPVWTTIFMAEENWDLTAELIMLAVCLGTDEWQGPLLRLVAAQAADGSYPAPLGAGRDLVRGVTCPERQHFLTCYHSSLVGLLAAAMATATVSEQAAVDTATLVLASDVAHEECPA